MNQFQDKSNENNTTTMIRNCNHVVVLSFALDLQRQNLHTSACFKLRNVWLQYVICASRQTLHRLLWVAPSAWKRSVRIVGDRWKRGVRTSWCIKSAVIRRNIVHGFLSAHDQENKYCTAHKYIRSVNSANKTQVSSKHCGCECNTG